MTKHDEIKRAERRRVEDLLRRDREDRLADQAREDFRKARDSGGKVAERDVADGPTREQLAQGDFRMVSEVGTGDAREAAKVFRRMSVPTVQRMWAKGEISDDGLRACKWYSDTYDRSGLHGSMSSTDLQREVFAQPTARGLFTDNQIEAQDELRRVKEYMPTRFIKFFEAVVVKDVPIARCAHLAQRRYGAAKVKFCEIAEAVFSAAQEIGALE